ncbi:hypothetical protein RF11_03979 [Thelohanellus kitauei]|uniref:Uncharacterized protein n=1 Tax=Thelohanellus kitauei TaxID=669202 RepID=A0A0C2MFX5_THEKT|nr:hypothetical protein RF11_03979 [Thelohanellus kitauei]
MSKIGEVVSSLDQLLRIYRVNERIDDTAINTALLCDMNQSMNSQILKQIREEQETNTKLRHEIDGINKAKKLLYIGLRMANSRLRKRDKKYTELKRLYESSRKTIENIKHTLKVKPPVVDVQSTRGSDFSYLCSTVEKKRLSNSDQDLINISNCKEATLIPINDNRLNGLKNRDNAISSQLSDFKVNNINDLPSP